MNLHPAFNTLPRLWGWVLVDVLPKHHPVNSNISWRITQLTVLCGFVAINLSCSQTQCLTVYLCERVTMVRTDRGERAEMDPFADDRSTDTGQLEDLEESWTVTGRFRVEADSDLNRLLNYKAIPLSDQSRAVPMLPYIGALVLEGDRGRGAVLAAIKTDRETIRISGGRHRSSANFVVGGEEFDGLRYITDRPLAAKLVSMMQNQSNP